MAMPAPRAWSIAWSIVWSACRGFCVALRPADAEASGLMPIASAMRRSCSAAGGVCFQNAARAETCGSVTRSSMCCQVQPVEVISQA